MRLAETDRALLQAYLANGGTAFIQQYRVALTAYFAYLQSGQLPSQYETADPAALRQYLETLQATGLFEQVLGAQATFYAQYLAYLKQGGTIDGWQGLPANVFAGYATALASYQAYLAAGGLPSAYTALDPATDRGGPLDAIPGGRHRVGQGLGRIARSCIEGFGLRRAILAGGDTSGHALGERAVVARVGR